MLMQTGNIATNLDDELIALLIHQHRTQMRPALDRLWEYYRNNLDFESGDDQRPYAAAQEQGLPRRLTHPPFGLAHGKPQMEMAGGGSRREIVIENDIAWRIHTLVDFMFGKSVSIQSLAEDRELATVIERVLRAAFDANGGIAFFQDAALLGSVYGFVDLMLRTDRLPAMGGRAGGRSADGSATGDGGSKTAPSRPLNSERAISYASRIVLEAVEAPRAVPVLNPSDYRKLDGYVLHYTQQLNEVDRGTLLGRLVGRDGGSRGRQATVEVTEIWTADRVAIYHDRRLVEETANPLCMLPVVHIQNLPQPFFYEGLSEVEPLIPLQDELNTRLSDRANRVTFQSFKMYLGKGIENFLERPVAPGQMWTTDNPDASIVAFGGDGPNPSEDAHVTEIREAMDKVSAVTGVSAGLLRDKIGNLTSENALRVVMMGLLARIEKKRVTYGAGIERLCELILETMGMVGVLSTQPEDRRVRLHWPSPIPNNTMQRHEEAKLKLEIGVPRNLVLAELGYDAEDTSLNVEVK